MNKKNCWFIQYGDGAIFHFVFFFVLITSTWTTRSSCFNAMDSRVSDQYIAATTAERHYKLQKAVEGKKSSGECMTDSNDDVMWALALWNSLKGIALIRKSAEKLLPSQPLSATLNAKKFQAKRNAHTHTRTFPSPKVKQLMSDVVRFACFRSHRKVYTHSMPNVLWVNRWGNSKA